MAVSPDGQLVVNTSETTSMVHFIDAETLEVVDNVLVDTRPRVAAVHRRTASRSGCPRNCAEPSSVIDVAKP